MSQKRTFASVPIPEAIAKLAAEAPGGAPVAPPAELGAAATSAPPEPVQSPVFREREATQKMTVNMPKALYEELRAFMKLTDIPMSDVLVEGARRELDRLKRQGR